MAIDYSKLGASNSADTVLHPRDIFRVLPAKSPKYQYPRDVQTEVWSDWFGRRNERDLVLKMNTGSGKTVVGLLILKSCLNEGKGPALYIAPDKYLSAQVIAEAESLGVPVTEDADSPSFLRGNAILVTNIYKLINGRSVFGVGAEGAKKRIGSLLIDDVHACVATTESQFTMRASALPAENDNTAAGPYEQLLELFKDDLEKQSPTTALDVIQQEPGKNMVVPFWAWREKGSKTAKLLHQAKESDDLRFTWPLLHEVLPLCQCVFGGGVFELSTRCLPIDVIPSFVAAGRRVFMSATLAEDSVLVTHFDVQHTAALNPLTPSIANDVGDRVILIPQELNPDLNDADLKEMVEALAEKYNVVVIVPSRYRAEFWGVDKDRILMADNIEHGVDRLKAGHVGLVVIVNKYDGIDLPNDACRVLVLDGLPEVRRKIDRIEDAILHGTDEQLARTMQRIEQGMGRGVRSTDDYCAVILMGKSLTAHLYAQRAIDRLTPATKAQFELSQQLSQQLRGKGTAQISGVIEDVLRRDQGWVTASKGALVRIAYDRTGRVGQIPLAQRKAFASAQRGDYGAAAEPLQEVVNTEKDARTKGWLKQQLAEMKDFVDPVEAQQILKSALEDNRLVLKPIAGISYQRLQSDTTSQAYRAMQAIKFSGLTANNLLIDADSLIDTLKFYPGTATAFEKAIARIGHLIGFASQRPEAEFGHGPDVLWSLGDLRYFVIECKNGVTTGVISKHDANQLTGSVNWFSQRYDKSCSVTPVMFHPTSLLDKSASAHPDMVIVTVEKLAELKAALQGFFRAVTGGAYPPAEKDVAGFLQYYKLTSELFLKHYTVKWRTK